MLRYYPNLFVSRSTRSWLSPYPQHTDPGVHRRWSCLLLVVPAFVSEEEFTPPSPPIAHAWTITRLPKTATNETFDDVCIVEGVAGEQLGGLRAARFTTG